jgi:Mg2+-importing ATPase
MIIIFITINTTLGFFQEYKSEKSLELLKKFVSVRARVRRNNKEVLLDSQEIVPGDILIFEAGDIISADVRIIKNDSLLVDEEVLTGESVPIKKTANPLSSEKTEIYQASNIVFSGCRVIEGRGEGVVIATGSNTVVGDIAALTQETKKSSLFEKNITKLSKFILYLVGVTLVFVFGANLLIKGEAADKIELIIFSIALAVSVIPEALPLVISLSLSKGAIRLAKKKVVVRRLSAIEDLGGIEILCTDKTGTITENKLTVNSIKSGDEKKCFYYASAGTSFLNDKKIEPNNAFDIALWNKITPAERKQIKTLKRMAELPFTPERRRNSVLVKLSKGAELIVRGAPEEIFGLCSNLKNGEQKAYEKWMSEQGGQGCRILAVAVKSISPKLSTKLKEQENDLEFLGIISFVDPIKETARDAVKEAGGLGVQVKILTGDSPEVAAAVAMEIGLIKSEEEMMTGEKFINLSEAKKIEAVKTKNVFARVTPKQKFEIIRCLQKIFQVGYLGEGINDAPALQAANVSLVVDSASDIARESADIILLQSSLHVIIEGIKEGRQIFANTVKYIKTTIASNFGNFYAIVVATLLIDYLPMLPLQILLLNLLSDFPMIAIATDNVDKDELKLPKNYDFKDLILFATLIGLVSSIFDFIFFGFFSRISPEVLHTNWFIGSILTEIVLIFSLRTKFIFFRTKRPGWSLTFLSVAAIVATISIPFTEIGHSLFGFISPTYNDIVLIFSIVVAYFAVTEIVKALYYKFLHHENNSDIVLKLNNTKV